MPSQTARTPQPRPGKSGLSYTIPCRRDEKPPNRSPGPANYDTIKLSVHKSAAPSYSIGGRTKELPKTIASPGPKYLPKLPTVGPKGYSFGIRTSTGPYIVPEDR